MGTSGRPLAPIDVVVGEPAKAKAKEMLARVQDGRFAGDDAVADHAEAFVWIAATSTDPVLVGEALAIASAAEKNLPAAFGPVLADRIGCQDAAVLRGVEEALRYVLENPDMAAEPTLLAAISAAARAHPNAAISTAARAGLLKLPADRPEVAATIEAIDPADTPATLYAVLDALQLSREDAVASKAAAKERSLLSHPDPAVRGTAARVLGLHADPKDATAVSALVERLKDEHAYVRCGAVEGLGSLRALAAVSAVAGLLDDAAKCTHDLTSPAVEGSPDTRPIGRPITVGFAATLSLQSTSFATTQPLQLGTVSATDPSSLATAAESAKAWAAARG